MDGFRIMFFGGAASIDKAYRIDRVSWWKEELITYGQLQKTLAEERGQIDIMLSHDHPTIIPYSRDRYKLLFGEGDQMALQVLFDRYEPKVWMFGHHHKGAYGQVEETEWKLKRSGRR